MKKVITILAIILLGFIFLKYSKKISPKEEVVVPGPNESMDELYEKSFKKTESSIPPPAEASMEVSAEGSQSGI